MTDLRGKIFAADDITKELVEVPEWGVAVEIRSMTAGQRATLTEGATSADKVDVSNMYAKTVIATVFDPETGLPVFTEKTVKPSFQRMVQSLSVWQQRLSAVQV